jgi:hypothetical protein
MFLGFMFVFMDRAGIVPASPADFETDLGQYREDQDPGRREEGQGTDKPVLGVEQDDQQNNYNTGDTCWSIRLLFPSAGGSV